MPILVVTKLLFMFMPIYHIKKFPSKNIIFWAFCIGTQSDQNKGAFPSIGTRITILPITLSSLVQSRKFI